MSTRRTRILEYIRAHPDCTSSEIRDAVLPAQSTQSVGAILGNLIAEGALGADRRYSPRKKDTILHYRVLRGGTPLSPGQWRVLQFMVAGLSAKEAGEKLGISTSAATERMRAAVKNMGARNRVHAAALAVARGLVHEAALRP